MSAPAGAIGVQPPAIQVSGRRALIASWIGWMFDGYETYALVLVMSVAVPQLIPAAKLAQAPLYMGALLAVTLFGWALGGIAAGVLADYVGRRRMLMASILCYAFFAGLTALSPNYWFLLIFRFCTGLGLGAEWGPGAAIVAESWAPASRGRALGMLHLGFGVGSLFAVAVWSFVNPLGASAWRYLFLVGVVPALALVYIRRSVEEPGLWVATDRGRREARMRKRRGVLSENDRQLLQFTLRRLFSDRELRRRLGLLFVMSVSTVVGWWSVSTWIPQYAAQLGAHLPQPRLGWATSAAIAFNVGAIAGYATLGFLADALGRKPSTCLYYIGALGFALSFFLLTKDTNTILPLAGLNGFFSGGQFAWMTIYLPELFPTSVRGSAISIVFDAARAIAAFGPLTAGWLISTFGGIGQAAAIMSIIYLLGLSATAFAGPETKGTLLPT